jgi:hypothetical protein
MNSWQENLKNKAKIENELIANSKKPKVPVETMED